MHLHSCDMCMVASLRLASSVWHECVLRVAQLTDNDEALQDEEEEAQRLQREAAEQLQPEDFEQEQEEDASSSSDEETDTMGAKARQVQHSRSFTHCQAILNLPRSLASNGDGFCSRSCLCASALASGMSGRTHSR